MAEEHDPAYSTTLVTYVDILGFGELIKESQTHAFKIAQIQGFLEQLNQVGDTPRRHPKHSEQEFVPFNFSDLIVRSTTIASEMVWYDVVDWELFYLAEQQMNLVTQGMLLRGGISVGNLRVSPNRRIVFGPALVRSYELERDFATYPRLVIDRELISKARNDGHFPAMADFIHRGEDGVYFLDYLFGACVSEVLSFPEIEDLRARIASHQKAIEMLVSRSQGKGERIRQKHAWLRLYHNSTVLRLEERLGPKRIGATANLMVGDPEGGI